MTSPQKNTSDHSAKSRIENAFWILLELLPYSYIPIKHLAYETKANHKTICYHFDSIETLAKVPI